MKKDELNGLIIGHKPVSSSSLKRLLLIFDRIIFIDPEENRHLIPDYAASIKYNSMDIEMMRYGVLYNGEQNSSIEYNILNEFEYADKKGLIQVIDLKARKFYNKNWLPLRLAYEYDTANATLVNSLIPLVTKKEDYSRESGIFRGGFIEPSGHKIYPNIPEAVQFHDESDNKKYGCDHQMWSILAKLNRSLAVSYEFDLIPIFLNEHLAKTYSLKTEIAKSCSNTQVNKMFELKNNHSLASVQYLLYRISETILPDEIIENIPLHELIYARNNSFEKCMKLRRKLINSIKVLSEQQFDENTINNLEEYINKEVVPLANEYNLKFTDTFSKFLKNSISFSLSYGATYYSLVQTLSPMATSFLSGISATVANITSDLVDHSTKKKLDSAKNTFSYFINLKE